MIFGVVSTYLTADRMTYANYRFLSVNWEVHFLHDLVHYIHSFIRGLRVGTLVTLTVSSAIIGADCVLSLKFLLESNQINGSGPTTDLKKDCWIRDFFVV